LEPLDFYGFPLTDCKPLIRAFEAPEEVIESLDEVVNRLLLLIIAQDIVPVLPVWEEVKDDIIEKIISEIFVEKDALQTISDLPIDLLLQMQPNDIPAFITPEEVILGLLHNKVLLAIPLIRPPRDLADDIEDLVALDIEPANSGEDLTDPVVTQLLNKYRRFE
jgi:hypothetical protein